MIKKYLDFSGLTELVNKLKAFFQKKEFTGTHDEWNQLTPAEKAKYEIVNFTDDLESAYQDVYSTEEVKTNKVWIDGKPIYKKVYPVTIIDPASGVERNIILDDTLNRNNTKLISYGGYLEPGTSGDSYVKGIPYTYLVSGGNYASISCAISLSDLVMVYSNVNPGNTGYIWVEYIKTTE